MFEQIQTGGMAALQKAMSDPVSEFTYFLPLAAALHRISHVLCLNRPCPDQNAKAPPRRHYEHLNHGDLQI